MPQEATQNVSLLKLKFGLKLWSPILKKRKRRI